MFIHIVFHHRSNCDVKVMKIIRKHYKRPEFIPDDSESSELDWIFVGGHGKGAQMHVSLAFVCFCF